MRDLRVMKWLNKLSFILGLCGMGLSSYVLVKTILESVQ